MIQSSTISRVCICVRGIERQDQMLVITQDVARTFIDIKDHDETHCQQLRQQLQTLLEQLMHLHPDFSYYQGLNHVAATFLLVLSPSAALLATEAVCQQHFEYL